MRMMAKWNGLNIVIYLNRGWHYLDFMYGGGDDGQAQCHILFYAPVTQLWNSSIRMGTEYLCENEKERKWHVWNTFVW